jgi:phosphoglucosamine mutase
MLTSALISGLLTGGSKVHIAGMAPTPAVAYMGGKQGADAAIIVTASHNPPEYNGFKFHNPDGAGFSANQQASIESLVDSSGPVSWEDFGATSSIEPIPIYIEAIEDTCTITKRHRVVLDAALGAGGLVTPTLLDKLKAKVTAIGVPPSGKDYAQNIPHSKIQSAAAAEWQHFVNLDRLSALVRSKKAEVGFAHDGDADRLLAVDDKGRILAGDTLLALVADYYLAARGGRVIATTVSSSSVVDHIAAKHGARVARCRVGDVFVSNLVKEHQAVLGAEPSGPFIFPEVHYCPDGPLAACKVLELLDWAKRPLSALVDDLPGMHLLRASVKCPNHAKPAVMGHVASALDGWPEVEEVSQLDGVRARFSDTSWVLIRPSGTEPVIRITVEAQSARRAKALIQKAERVTREKIP